LALLNDSMRALRLERQTAERNQGFIRGGVNSRSLCTIGSGMWAWIFASPRSPLGQVPPHSQARSASRQEALLSLDRPRCTRSIGAAPFDDEWHRLRHPRKTQELGNSRSAAGPRQPVQADSANTTCVTVEVAFCALQECTMENSCAASSSTWPSSSLTAHLAETRLRQRR